MKKKSTRIISTLIAVALGVLLILLFTLIGENSKGPLEDFLVKTGTYINDLDDEYVTKRNSKKRAKSMKWFEKYRTNLDSLKNPTKILLGAFDNNTEVSFQAVMNIEDSLQAQLPFISIYTAWGSHPEQRFPMQKAEAIYSLGSIPVLTWEPWLNEFDSEKHPELRSEDKRDFGGMKDVANGVYDFYLKRWARDAKIFNKPILVRFGHEMNDPYRYTWGPQNNTADEFVSAWQHVVDYFKQEGVTNIIWMWSPHIAYGYFNEYYPGDEYVDWVGIGALNYGKVAVWSDWWSFDEVYGKYYNDLTVFNKPIMLTEFGSLAVGGDRAIWYKDALSQLPSKYPLTKSVVFFHFDNDYTLTNKSLNWYFVNDSVVCDSITSSLQSWDK